MISNLLRKAASMLALLLLGHGAAHAGLVTGRWDPLFGTFLPGLNWQVRAQLLVPNTCAGLADGIYAISDPDCAGSKIDAIYLRLFDTGEDPDDFFTITGTLTATTSTYWGWCDNASTEPHCYNFGAGFFPISNLRVLAGQIVGFDAPAQFAQSLYTYLMIQYTGPTTAGGNTFGLAFTTNGPTLECLVCRQDLNDPFGTSSEFGSTTNLTQFLVTYTSSDTSTPKFTDGNGNPVGVKLDDVGRFVGLFNTNGVPVPEPGTISLVLAALMAGGIAARRRRR